MIGPNEEAPLQILPYFKFLNEYAQMSIMRQLIEKFQRTSITPRNYVMLPTPRFDIGTALTSSNYEVDPNCFDALSPRIGGTGGNKESKESTVDPVESRLKQNEGASIDAAVTVALQVASGSATAEQILSLLLGVSGGSGGGSGGVTSQSEGQDKSTI